MAASGETSNELDASFMYTNILKEIILSIQFEPKHIQQFIVYCRNLFAGNTDKLKYVDELEKKYRDETPIWWYTRGSLLRDMINKALQQMDLGVVIKTGFFVRDLHRDIEQLHLKQFSKHQSSKVFTVYRGEGLPKTDFDQLKRRKGGLIAYNKFLSTSTNRQASLDRAHQELNNPDSVGIVYVMTIDPSKTTTPFAEITDVSYHQAAKDEILFSMHTIFRIREIKPLEENHHLFQVELTLTNDEDIQLRALAEHIREDIYQQPNEWQQLSLLASKVGDFDVAEQISLAQLDEGNNADGDGKEQTYKQLGSTKFDQGEYEEAITFYKKVLDIQKEANPPNYSGLASAYNDIGKVYDAMGNCSQALSYYENGLKTQQKCLPPDHPELATSYDNLGGVNSNMGEYSEALSYYEKALKIVQKSLPPNHPQLATSYSNIGKVYDNMGDNSKALQYYEKALPILQGSLPPNHPTFATFNSNIGEVYSKMGQYSKAILHYQKALEIFQHCFPPSHPMLRELQENIELMITKL